eukprot:359402-Chlamydomonas_euryale.AAC.8
MPPGIALSPKRVIETLSRTVGTTVAREHLWLLHLPPPPDHEHACVVRDERGDAERNGCFPQAPVDHAQRPPDPKCNKHGPVQTSHGSHTCGSAADGLRPPSPVYLSILLVKCSPSSPSRRLPYIGSRDPFDPLGIFLALSTCAALRSHLLGGERGRRVGGKSDHRWRCRPTPTPIAHADAVLTVQDRDGAAVAAALCKDLVWILGILESRDAQERAYRLEFSLETIVENARGPAG